MTEIINRENAEAIIEEQVEKENTKDVTNSSKFMTMEKKLYQICHLKCIKVRSLE